MIRLSDDCVSETVNGAEATRLEALNSEGEPADAVAIYRDTSAKVNAFGPDPTA
jgi:hypothetical protein